MMPSYLKIKNAVEGEETDSVEAENEEKDMEAESAVTVEFKRKKMSAAGGSSAVAAPPCCLVESCGADLRGCKKYHQRHRVCEVHAKAPVIMVDGLNQRFCQQCSRFHELAEFDQTKRSCRRRLAGHNERRRKSPQDSPKERSSTPRLKQTT